MLTSKQILDVVGAEPSGLLSGKVAYLRRSLQTRMGRTGPDSHHQFLGDVAEQCANVNPNPKAASYQHPADDPRVRAAKPSDGLSASDLAWINRLPSDPRRSPTTTPSSSPVSPPG